MGNWCDDCGRLKKIGCACGLSFQEKATSVAFGFDGWADNTAPLNRPENYPKGGKLSKHKPKNYS